MYNMYTLLEVLEIHSHRFRFVIYRQSDPPNQLNKTSIELTETYSKMIIFLIFCLRAFFWNENTNL